MFVRSKTDRCFAQFCRTGDADALAFVFDQTAGQLLRVALWLSRQRADAEDLLQRTFVQAIALRERFEPGRRVLPWLLGLMANQAHLLRRERQRRAVAVVVERVVDPEVEIVARELQDAVRAVRAKLREPYRDVLELHLEQGLDAGEIAQRLGRPAGTVRTQLMRALELLRKRLPSGFVAGFAPLTIAGEPVVGAVRESVMAAAGRAASPVMASGAVVVIGGVLMAKKLLWVVPVMAMVVSFAAYQEWRGAAAERASPQPLMRTAVARPDEVEPREPVERTALAMPATVGEAKPGADAAFDKRPVRVEPWLARFLVVDAEDEPVVGAKVEVWAANRSKPDPGLARLTSYTGNQYSGHDAQPLCELRTDASGRAEQMLGFEACLAAASSGDGVRSAESFARRDRETKFVFGEPVILQGVVFGTDRRPAAGARVELRSNGGTLGPTPEPVVTDMEGHFRVSVILHGAYWARAEKQGDWTFDQYVSIRSRTPADLELSFPGGITLDGMVVDSFGSAVAAARVAGWREYHLDDPQQDADDEERVVGTTGEDGRFSIPVRKLARYQLIASKQGHANSSVLWTETTAVRPHADARLELLAFAHIRGRVEHGDGRPFAGVVVAARAESGKATTAAAVPDQKALFAYVADATTNADGGFELCVHPQTSWTLYAVPIAANPWLRFSQSGVAPGREDVVLRVTDDDLAGCIVHGTVRRGDGQAPGEYLVELLDCEGGELRSCGDARPRILGDHFIVPALPRGGHYGLRVSLKGSGDRSVRYPGPLAPVQVGPFKTDQNELEFEFCLQPWGEVPVRVLDAAGLSARKVRIAALRDVPVGYWPSAQPVEKDGTTLLQRCVPGAHHLRVFRESELVREQDLLITPGLNPEVTVRLPAK